MFSRIIPSDTNGSCVVDALSIALDKPVNDIKEDLKKYNGNPKCENVWGKYLMDNGFHRVNIELKANEPRISLGKLASISLVNQTLICKCAEHIVTIKNRIIYDTDDRLGLSVFWYYTR